MVIKDWRIKELTGYVPITSFYRDFSIADNFGLSAIKDTYQRAFSEWKSDYKYLTELVLALNWKIWEHNETNPSFAKLYNRLYEEARDWALSHLKGEELKYYIRTTD